MTPLTLIVAATKQNGIGQKSTMPWHIPRDLAYFSRITTEAPAAQMNTVFMGRRTWESIPSKFRPLRKRVNVVLSHNKNYDLLLGDTATYPTHLCSDLKIAVETFGSQTNVHRLFIIGGASLYQEALALEKHHPDCLPLQADRILVTRIHNPKFDCDVFFPDVLGGTEWRKASHEEHSAWVGFEVPEGIQMENGVAFEYQMWIRSQEHCGLTKQGP